MLLLQSFAIHDIRSIKSCQGLGQAVRDPRYVAGAVDKAQGRQVRLKSLCVSAPGRARVSVSSLFGLHAIYR